jgi:hypothetical protein
LSAALGISEAPLRPATPLQLIRAAHILHSQNFRTTIGRSSLLPKAELLPILGRLPKHPAK